MAVISVPLVSVDSMGAGLVAALPGAMTASLTEPVCSTAFPLNRVLDVERKLERTTSTGRVELNRERPSKRLNNIRLGLA